MHTARHACLFRCSGTHCRYFINKLKEFLSHLAAECYRPSLTLRYGCNPQLRQGQNHGEKNITQKMLSTWLPITSEEDVLVDICEQSDDNGKLNCSFNRHHAVHAYILSM